MIRQECLDSTARRIVRLESPRTVRVAIDGVDAAGKTILADELAECVAALRRPVIRAGIDGFHQSRSIRYRRGRNSAEGYYRDSFDLDGLIAALLQPLGPGGTGTYRTALFDHRADAAVDAPQLKAEPRAILLFDGIFLLRPELRPFWDYAIFLRARFDVTLARALRRDAALLGSVESVEDRYKSRYIPAQRIYLDTCRPESRADLVIDNNDPDNATIVTDRSRAHPPGSDC
jgi:uridine kinase